MRLTDISKAVTCPWRNWQGTEAQKCRKATLAAKRIVRDGQKPLNLPHQLIDADDWVMNDLDLAHDGRGSWISGFHLDEHIVHVAEQIDLCPNWCCCLLLFFLFPFLFILLHCSSLRFLTILSWAIRGSWRNPKILRTIRYEPGKRAEGILKWAVGILSPLREKDTCRQNRVV